MSFSASLNRFTPSISFRKIFSQLREKKKKYEIQKGIECVLGILFQESWSVHFLSIDPRPLFRSYVFNVFDHCNVTVHITVRCTARVWFQPMPVIVACSLSWTHLCTHLLLWEKGEIENCSCILPSHLICTSKSSKGFYVLTIFKTW